MTPKKEADHLISLSSLTILAEIGHKLSKDEVTAIAKALSLITVDEIIKILNPQTFGLEMQEAFDKIYHWQQVRNEIEKYGQD